MIKKIVEIHLYLLDICVNERHNQLNEVEIEYLKEHKALVVEQLDEFD